MARNNLFGGSFSGDLNQVDNTTTLMSAVLNGELDLHGASSFLKTKIKYTMEELDELEDKLVLVLDNGECPSEKAVGLALMNDAKMKEIANASISSSTTSSSSSSSSKESSEENISSVFPVAEFFKYDLNGLKGSALKQ